MEAGSETRSLKRQNSLYNGEIFLFLSFIILNPNIFLTNISDQISFVKKGILIPVSSGFIFLFLFSARPISLQHYHLIINKIKTLKDKNQVLSAITSIMAGDLKNCINKLILFKLSAAPRYSGFKEIPGLISVEAPSSRIGLQDIIASNSCMFNQIPCL